MGWRGWAERYGVSAAVVAGLALVVTLLPGNTDGTSLATGGAGQTFTTTPDGAVVPSGSGAGAGGSSVAGGSGVVTGGGSGGSGGAAGGGGGSGGGGGATATGAAAGGGGGGGGGLPGPGASAAFAFGEGPHCRADGRQVGISSYMPPCVRWDGGDNGGATYDGVTADQIVVVRYLGQIDPGTSAILQSADLADDRGTVARAYDAIRRYGNLHYQTYGREVVFRDFEASGPSENDEAMVADAVEIAEEIRPFAVIEGDPAAAMPPVLIRELALRGVLCMCSTSLTSEFYNQTGGRIISSLPTINEYAIHAAEYIAKRLAGQPAAFAGDEINPAQSLRDNERRFGLIYLNGSRGRIDPEQERWREIIVAEFARYGLSFAAEIGYNYQPGRNQQDVTNLIAQLKDAGVTTIVPLWDPLYPILITREATNQLYFPEWFIVGTGLSDTISAGRLYDQNQWSHAFGISPLWVPWATTSVSSGYREYHHMADGDSGVLINIYNARINSFLMGVHMAGPNLTQESFLNGIYSYPPSGGRPTGPLVYYTPQYPTAGKDFSEVWWDPSITGPDERGSQQSSGSMLRADGGARYEIGEWPTGPPSRNNPANLSDDQGHDPHEADGHTHDPAQRCLSCS